MNHIERTYVVPQPYQVNAANADRRRKPRDGRPFELESGGADVPARAEAASEPLQPPSGDEGVGEHVNIVV
jgi:hypothetical protein